MSKFVVCCDMDNCLNNLIEQMLKMYNDKYGTNYTQEDVHTYELEESFHLEEAEKMKELFLEKELWDNLVPVEKAQWGLQSLINRGYDVYIVTATHADNFAWKVAWIKKYFHFFDEKNIIRIHDKSLIAADVLIEDCYANLVESRCFTERVLLDYPWNQSDKDWIFGINRAYNWEDVVRFVNKIYKGME